MIKSENISYLGKELKIIRLFGFLGLASIIFTGLMLYFNYDFAE